MKQTIYVDILLITNLIVNYYLLLTVRFFTKRTVKRWRLLIGATVASLFSLTIFLPAIPFLAEVVIKLIYSVLIVFITFSYISAKKFLKNIAFFYSANFIFAGIMLALWFFVTPTGLMINNGIVYINVSALTLVISTIVTYFLVLLISKLTRHETILVQNYSVTLEMLGEAVVLKGFMDTGNTLRDTFTDTPVIICQYKSVKAIIPQELKELFQIKTFEVGYYQSILHNPYAKRFRVIPYDGVNQAGLLPALFIDRMVLSSGEKQYEIQNVLMAVTHKPLASGDFDVLLNANLIAV